MVWQKVDVGLNHLTLSKTAYVLFSVCHHAFLKSKQIFHLSFFLFKVGAAYDSTVSGFNLCDDINFIFLSYLIQY